jgi:hypothetical protein
MTCRGRLAAGHLLRLRTEDQGLPRHYLVERWHDVDPLNISPRR